MSGLRSRSEGIISEIAPSVPATIRERNGSSGYVAQLGGVTSRDRPCMHSGYHVRYISPLKKLTISPNGPSTKVALWGRLAPVGQRKFTPYLSRCSHDFPAVNPSFASNARRPSHNAFTT